MLNKEYYISIKTILGQNDERAIHDAMDNFLEELEYELTELLVDRNYDELNNWLHSSKMIKKLLTEFVDHDISCQIGMIMGILQITEAFVYRQNSSEVDEYQDISIIFKRN